jgi:hypothetical protein
MVGAREILTSVKAYGGAMNDVLAGRTSKTLGPLDVWKLADGRLLLVDGQHRFVEGLRAGKREFEVKVVGEGESDYYATPKKGEEYRMAPAWTPARDVSRRTKLENQIQKGIREGKTKLPDDPFKGFRQGGR